MDTFKKINYIFSKKQKIRLFFLFIIILIGTVLELLGVTLILPFVNVVMSPQSIQEQSYLNAIYHFLNMESNTQFLIFLGVLLMSIYIIKNVYLVFMYDMQFRFVYENQRQLSTRLMKCYMNQPYLFHVEHNSAELLRNVSNDSTMFFAATLAVLQLMTELSVCFALFIYLLIMDVMITISVSVLLVGFVFVFLKIFKKQIARLGTSSRIHNAAMHKWILQGFGGIKETKILEREGFFVNNYDEDYRKFAECQRKFQLESILPRPVMEACCICGLMIVVIVKLSSGVVMTEFLPILSVFAVAAFRMLPSFNRISLYISSITFNKAAVIEVYNSLNNIEKLVDVAKENIEKNDFINLKFEDSIQIKDITFSYPNTTEAVLSKVNMEVPKNKSIALIGPSGAGKTTMADVILGVLDPQEGEILVDGINILNHMSEWHAKIGYIPQTIYLMDDTLRNNIAYGLWEEEIDEEKIWNALKDAQLKEFVEGLEKGLDTIIGEGGVRLSGGQRQRIGIARALYNNPDILVLDEATSALDNNTENAVMEAINNLMGSKTLIIIAHRLSTIEKCDIVYEVKDKKIAIKGLE